VSGTAAGFPGLRLMFKAYASSFAIAGGLDSQGVELKSIRFMRRGRSDFFALIFSLATSSQQAFPSSTISIAHPDFGIPSPF